MKARLRGRLGRLGPALSGARLWTVLGVLSASIIMVNVNVLSARFYQRWDWTETHAFTLAPATQRILESLSEPLEIVVFLARSDRLLADVRHMLSEYQAHTRKLKVRYVDPERDPAEFVSLQQKFGIVAGKTEDGKLLTDASLVIAKGKQRWFITVDDMLGLDADGNVEPRLENALTEGIAQVTQGEAVSICFTSGHQEVSIDDVGPHGLAEFRMRLTKSNFDVEVQDLSGASPRADALSECRVVVVAGPKTVFGARALAALSSYYEQGGNLLLMLDPMVDEQGRLGETGLEPLTRAAGITLGENFVIESDPELRLPNGFGEAFLATPSNHAITNGLIRAGTKVDFRVLLVGAQSLGTTDDSIAKPLLTSSKRSFALTDLSGVQQGQNQLLPRGTDATGPHYLALAVDPAKPTGQGAERRVVVTGAVNLGWSRNWRDPTLVGNRLLIENSIAWLAAKPALVSIPKRRSFPAGLSLTEDSLSEVLMYVMVYMPLTAVLVAAFVLYRRRRTEDTAAAESEGDSA